VTVAPDVVIRGGTVVDGTGGASRTADVAISGGVITEVGGVRASGRREIDAGGAIVTPGFVDIHTHYDGQATWDERLQPSSALGVTTAVMGNCGVGFAPVRERDRAQLIELMEGVEDLPGAVLHEGLPWAWETIGEYLDALETIPHDIDFAAQVCHGPLRLYVMGQRGADREPATADEIAEMGRIAAAGIRDGALGFTTSRTLNHRTSRGEPTPTLTAAREELVGIAAEIGRTGTGVLQVISDFLDFESESATLLEMMRASHRPMSVSVLQATPGDSYRRVLALIEAANEQGLTMRGQVASRAIGAVVGLEGSMNPLNRSPLYRSLTGLPKQQLLAQLRDPSVRQRILDELRGSRFPLDRLFDLGDPPDYAPTPDRSVAARAAAAGQDPLDALYDRLLERDGTAVLYMTLLNYFDGDLGAVSEMLAHPYSVPGLGDGGAHVGTICDASFPTTLLTHWVRDRELDSRFTLEWAIERQCRATAATVGLHDRGVIAPGYKADVNVIDFGGLRLHEPAFSRDLPAGGTRLLQAASGYLHTFVSGTETYADGEPTAALPGRLVRGARPRPRT
jgi:N-acyl-D-aspartate/D-glutamate deacylase